MDDPDHVVAACAAYRLHKHSFGVEYLAKKLKPINASKAELQEWIKDLDSEDTAVAFAAAEALKFNPPDIELPPDDQLALLNTNIGYVRWFKLHGHTVSAGAVLEKPKSVNSGVPGYHRVDYRYTLPGRVGNYSNFLMYTAATNEKHSPHSQLRLGLYVLALNDNKLAKSALAEFAKGDERLSATRLGKSLFEKGLKLNPDYFVPKFIPGWATFGTEQTGYLFLFMIQYPKSDGFDKFLAKTLTRIEPSKKDVQKWLTDLNSVDDKLWKPAFQSLLIQHPSLALTFEEQIEHVDSPVGISRLCLVHLGRAIDEGGNDSFSFTRVKLVQGNLHFMTAGNSQYIVENTASEKFRHVPWIFTRLMIPVLQHRDTPDAKKLLEELAKGHPDILPTREAKAVLK